MERRCDVNLGLSSGINFGLVFIEGFVSFFSPCVIPLIPLYMGYLAGGFGESDDGKPSYNRKNILVHTIFFILGISTAFFILGLGFTSLGGMLREYRGIISKVGGIIIILLGLNQLGVLKLNFLNKQLKLNSKIDVKKMNPIVAFVMGFGFSFAWTPCVGPALASVLILASNAKSVLEGNLLVLVYILGFLIPFLILGIFTGETLNFVKKNPKIMNTIVKIGAVVLIIMGGLLLTGTLDKIEGSFKTAQTQSNTSDDTGRIKPDDKSSENKEGSADKDSKSNVVDTSKNDGKNDKDRSISKTEGSTSNNDVKNKDVSKKNEVTNNKESKKDVGLSAKSTTSKNDGKKKDVAKSKEVAINKNTKNTVVAKANVSANNKSGKSNSVSKVKPKKDNKNAVVSKNSGNTVKKDDNTSNERLMRPIKLKDQNGNLVDLSTQKGKTLFVNFFATWCPPCRQEIPDLEKLYKTTGENKKDVYVVGIVNISDGRQSMEDVRKLIKEYNITYPILIDEDESVFQSYEIFSFPMTFFIDKKLEVKGYYPGSMKYDEMKSILKEVEK